MSPNNNSQPALKLPRVFIGAWLMALVAISIFIRVHGANDYYYSPDEAMHTDIASGVSLTEVLRSSVYEAHPPMLYILCHYWMAFSHDPAFVRGLPLLLGILLILLYYLIGKKLNDEFTGMCCALIVAFSRGCIIQSYIVRHYTVLLFFLSLSLYCYLHWRSSRKASALWGYGVCAALACLSDFTGVLSVFCITAYELLGMQQRKTAWRIQVCWAFLNLAIGLMTVGLVFAWRSMLMNLHNYNVFSLAWGTRITLMLLCPLATAFYLFPSSASTIPMAGFFAVAALWPGSAARRNKVLRQQLALMGFAVALDMALFISSKSVFIAGRHNTWIFPFFIPVLGWLMADVCIRVAVRLNRLRSTQWLACMAIALTAAGWAMYSPSERFADDSEYAMKRSQHDAVERFFATRRADDLLFLSRDDAVLFTNIYPTLYATPPSANIILMPYLNTHILFNPSFRFMEKKDSLLNTFTAADAQHMLAGVQRLVFFYSLWQNSVVRKLTLCPMLDKEIIAFPPVEPGHRFTREELDHQAAMVIIIPKKTFLADILAPDGKARACIANDQDTAPESMPSLF